MSIDSTVHIISCLNRDIDGLLRNAAEEQAYIENHQDGTHYHLEITDPYIDYCRVDGCAGEDPISVTIAALEELLEKVRDLYPLGRLEGTRHLDKYGKEVVYKESNP